MVYRNGDIRAHVCAWEAIDKAFGGILSAPDFRMPNTPAEYEEWVRFKMDLIARLYEGFCKRSIIGGPVDGNFVHRCREKGKTSTRGDNR